jgi:cytoskeletal protein CcmA (bactofilin family)
VSCSVAGCDSGGDVRLRLRTGFCGRKGSQPFYRDVVIPVSDSASLNPIIRHISSVQPFTHFPPRERTEPLETNRPDPSVVPGGALLSRGVSIKGSVKFLNELLLDGEVEGTIVSSGTLTIGEQARVRGEIRTKSVNVRGTVEGNIFVTERCELQANCTVRGDIEAPRLVVNENATFLGSAKVGTGKSLPA